MNCDCCKGKETCDLHRGIIQRTTMKICQLCLDAAVRSGANKETFLMNLGIELDIEELEKELGGNHD